MGHLEWTFELRFLVALGLGLLVGLERESVKLRDNRRILIGVRTYTIISLFGFGCAWLHQTGISSALPLGLFTVTALAVAGYLARIREGQAGWTSEIAAALTYITGALALLTDIWVPVTLAVVNTLLLTEKAGLERFVERLDKAEFLAVLKFLIVTVIILPALPNESFSQFQLNPARIWQIVILVSTVGFVGYLLAKKFGARHGLWLAGLLGGVVSSTAVAIAMGRLVQQDENRANHALQAALLASSVMYLRVLVLVWIINRAVVPFLWWPLATLALAGTLLSLWSGKGSKPTDPEHINNLQNPFEIRPALLFALVFVALSVATVLIEKNFGNPGLLGLSAVVGVTDIDPYILSLVRAVRPAGQIPITVVAILVAMMSNTLVKGGYFAFLARTARRQTFVRFGLLALLHLPVIWIVYRF